MRTRLLVFLEVQALEDFHSCLCGSGTQAISSKKVLTKRSIFLNQHSFCLQNDQIVMISIDGQWFQQNGKLYPLSFAGTDRIAVKVE